MAATLLALTAVSFTLPHVAPPTTSARAHVSMNFFSDAMAGIAKLQAGSYDEAEMKARVENEIKRKPCVMYATSSCPFCAEAKSALTAMGAVYTVHDFDEDEEGMAMKAELIKITEQTSVPQVFVGGQFVGGCNDGGMGGVLPLKKSGKLEELLIASGSLVKGARI